MNTARTAARFSMALLLVCAVALAALSGCESGPKEDPKEVKLAASANEIAARSGGDWEKLNSEEKTFMKNLQHGNEAAAKNLLFALSGQTHEGMWGKPGDGKTVKPAWANGTPPPQGTPSKP